MAQTVRAADQRHRCSSFLLEPLVPPAVVRGELWASPNIPPSLPRTHGRPVPRALVAADRGFRLSTSCSPRSWPHTVTSTCDSAVGLQAKGPGDGVMFKERTTRGVAEDRFRGQRSRRDVPIPWHCRCPKTTSARIPVGDRRVRTCMPGATGQEQGQGLLESPLTQQHASPPACPPIACGSLLTTQPNHGFHGCAWVAMCVSVGDLPSLAVKANTTTHNSHPAAVILFSDSPRAQAVPRHTWASNIRRLGCKVTVQ